MNCPLQTAEAEILLDYSAGRLDSAARTAVELHAANCAECASFLAEQNAVWNALDLWDAPPVSMDFTRRLWKRIDQSVEQPWYKTFADGLRTANWKPVIPLAAALLLIAGAFRLDHPGRQNAIPGVSIKEANQVEQTLDDVQLLRQLDPVSMTSKPM
jgi:anti-sigma factor RsiW